MSRVRATNEQKIAAGSLGSGEPAFLAVGKLRHSHGVHGEMLMEVLTDFPERLVPGMILYLGSGESQLRLLKSRPHREGLLMTFEGYTTPEEVGQLRNQVVYVHADDRPALEQGEFYQHQLIGLHVATVDGESLGKVIEIIETGASDVLVVRPPGGPDVLIPIVDAFVKQVDLSAGLITVLLIPGMRQEEA